MKTIMKKIISTLILLLVVQWGFSQITLTISGQATESTSGNPISGHPIFITVDSANALSPAGWGYYNTVNTDASGNYADTIQVPASITCGNLHAYTYDCNGTLHLLTNNFCPTPVNFPNQNFSFCVGSGGGVFGARILGNVYLNNGSPVGAPADFAEVFLIFHDTLAGTLTAIDTTTIDSSGYYAFDSVLPGDYLIKAALLPTSAQYWNYLPTYLGDELTWNLATTVTAPVNTILPAIGMIAGTNPGGPGFVGGLISAGANKTSGAGDPVVHVEVMVLDMSNNPVQYTYSDANGEFSFSNLAYGTYQIWAEVPGKVTTPAIVTIDANNPTINGVDLIINHSEVITTLTPSTPAEWAGVQLFPNPSNGVAHVSFELKQAEKVSMEVIALDGRTVYADAKQFQAGNHQLNFRLDQPKGIYLVKITAGDKMTVKQFLRN